MKVLVERRYGFSSQLETSFRKSFSLASTHKIGFVRVVDLMYHNAKEKLGAQF